MAKIAQVSNNLSNRLPALFFQQSADRLAEALLGKVLVRKLDSSLLSSDTNISDQSINSSLSKSSSSPNATRISAIIVETEAYMGPQDDCCHSFGGRKISRTEAMWKSAGTL